MPLRCFFIVLTPLEHGICLRVLFTPVDRHPQRIKASQDNALMANPSYRSPSLGHGLKDGTVVTDTPTSSSVVSI